MQIIVLLAGGDKSTQREDITWAYLQACFEVAGNDAAFIANARKRSPVPVI